MHSAVSVKGAASKPTVQTSLLVHGRQSAAGRQPQKTGPPIDRADGVQAFEFANPVNVVSRAPSIQVDERNQQVGGPKVITIRPDRNDEWIESTEQVDNGWEVLG